jgi:hypothetical protein
MAQADCLTNAIRELIPGAGAKPSTKPIRAAHTEFVVAVLGRHLQRLIPVVADAFDLEDRADHLNKVPNASSAYFTEVLDGTAQRPPGWPELRHIDALVSNLASGMTGALHYAVDGLARRGA